MFSEIASIGDKLELRKMYAIDENKRERFYISQVLDITTDGTVNIAMPIEKGRIIPLTIGDKYRLCIYSKKGLYQCNIVITNRYQESNLHILTIQVLSELEKFQRRQFYRLDCIIDTSYHCVYDQEIKLIAKINKNDFISDVDKSECFNRLEVIKKEWNQGIVTDLSGGGARFTSDQIIDIGLTVIMVINLELGGTMKQLQIQGVVISSIKMINRIGYYEHRVKYVDILKEEREAIIKFIFEEERRLRKREKGLK